MHKLLQIMSALRDPISGCPWDKKQTFKSIIPYTLEEAYEVADAIEQGDMSELKSELGDLLFQVVFYAQMASEQGEFDFNDIVDTVSEKLIRRHPHVFAEDSSIEQIILIKNNSHSVSSNVINESLNDTSLTNADVSTSQLKESYSGTTRANVTALTEAELEETRIYEARLNDAKLNDAWEQTKAAERNASAETDTARILDGVAKAMPALKRAQKLQTRAARVGFDWPEITPVLDKITEEITELREAMQQQNAAAITEETGDLIFSCVNLARHLKVDAEESLRACNHKFEQRFSYIEDTLTRSGRTFSSCSLDELEMLWVEAKKRGK